MVGQTGAQWASKGASELVRSPQLDRGCETPHACRLITGREIFVLECICLQQRACYIAQSLQAACTTALRLNEPSRTLCNEVPGQTATGPAEEHATSPTWLGQAQAQLEQEGLELE